MTPLMVHHDATVNEQPPDTLEPDCLVWSIFPWAVLW